MSRMGFLGAVGGAAKGFSAFLTEEQKQRRAQALEELRTTNRRETNRIDAEQRNTLATGRDAARAKSARELENLRQEGRLDELEFQRDNPTTQSTAMQSNYDFLVAPVEKGGAGLDKERAISIIAPRGQSGPTRREAMLDLVKSMTRGGVMDVEEARQSVRPFLDSVFGPERGAGTAPQFPRPPAIPGFQQPPSEAVQLLRQNPDSPIHRQSYEKYFGPGSADLALEQ